MKKNLHSKAAKLSRNHVTQNSDLFHLDEKKKEIEDVDVVIVVEGNNSRYKLNLPIDI